MKRNILLVSAATAVLSGMMLSSCGPVEEYEIKMTPKGNSLERSLTVHTNAEGGFTEAQLDRLVKIYHTPASRPATTQPTSSYSAEATFTEKTPDDVGGAGRYKNITADMGDLTFYVERFRGTDDLDAQLTDRLKAADRMAELIAGWIESQIKDPAEKKTLTTFLDGRFRNDFRNISLYTWLTAVRNSQPGMKLDQDGKITIADKYEDNDNPLVELSTRLGLYLDERGYMSAADFQTFIQGLLEQSDKSIKLFQRALARQMGVPDDKPTPNSLDFMNTAAGATASFMEYLKTTDEYKKLLDDWRKSPRDDKGDEPSPYQVIENLSKSASDLGGYSQDAIRLSISLPDKPVYTNGLWQEDKRELAWAYLLPGRDAKVVGLPSFAYAIWTKPNSDFQIARFGKIALSGKNLYEYIIWRKELFPADAKEWDAFVANLKPGADLEAKLGAFRFKSDPTTMPQGQTELPPGKAGNICMMILESLRQPATQPATQPI